MKVRLFSAIAFVAMALISCSEDTEGIGNSITDDSDKLVFNTGFFTATTKSILADSVYARTNAIYLGKVKDPETDAYVKTEFMSQFNMLEGFSLPDKSKIASMENGEVVADSCELMVFFNYGKSYGDTLAAMKLRVTELATPVEEPVDHYSNTDLKTSGYLRKGGIEKNQMFTMRDEVLSDSIRNLINNNLSLQGTSKDAGYYDMISIKLNDPYTDKEGKTYKNYGTYLMQKYYEHPEYFTNSYRFIHNVCPGFYFETTDGMGLMASVSNLQLKGYLRYTSDSTNTNSFSMASTSEILQTTRVTNDREALQRLVDDESCTYLKSPAGIFTEVDLPVDEITSAHAKDSLLSVAINFKRQNSNMDDVSYKLQKPDYALLIQKDSLYRFFEQEKMYDNKIAYLASLTTTNNYSYSNIGNLITLMKKNKENGLKSDPNWVAKHPDWNKAVLVPVSVSYSASTTSSGNTINAVSNQMSLASTKLVGGKNAPIEIKVIYAKFDDE